MTLRGWALVGLVGSGPAWAGEPPDLTFEWGGHVKAFGLASFPTKVDGLPDDLLHDLLNPLPDQVSGQAFLDGRLNLSLQVGPDVRIVAAHAITTSFDADATSDTANRAISEALQGDEPLAAFADFARLGALLDADTLQASTGSGGGGASPLSTGVGLNAPEALPLTWRAFDDPLRDVRVQGRTDRLYVKFSPERFDLTIGRQPVSFGHGLAFTPLDLVSPFTPATIDTEYKPGVDAVRVDGFFGTSGQITGVVAYTGSTYAYEDAADDERTAERISAAAYGQATFGVTDVGLFYGAIRGDQVVGATMVTGIGPLGLHADAAVTIPHPDLDQDPFFRGVVGIMGRPTGTTSLGGEVYVQTFGSTDSDAIFETLSSPRAQRGEVWQAGLAYASVNLSQEITPLLIGNLSVLANLTDPSFLLLPSVSWSIADNADASFGAFVGLGRRPEGRELDLDALGDAPTLDDLTVVTPRSEFGTYPATAFVQIRAYF